MPPTQPGSSTSAHKASETIAMIDNYMISITVFGSTKPQSPVPNRRDRRTFFIGNVKPLWYQANPGLSCRQRPNPRSGSRNRSGIRRQPGYRWPRIDLHFIGLTPSGTFIKIWPTANSKISSLTKVLYGQSTMA